MKNKNSFFIPFSLTVLMLVFFMAGCAEVTPIDPTVTAEPYGFLGGLWHGMIAPFSFFGSLFNEEVAMYAVNNNGAWYDFGFVLGAGILFGGGTKGSSG